MKGGAIRSPFTNPANAGELTRPEAPVVTGPIPEIAFQGIRRPPGPLARAYRPRDLSPTNGVADFVKISEGQKLTDDKTRHTPYYLKHEKNWTIGYGHNLGATEPPPGTLWTEQQAVDQLKKDMAGAADRVHRLVNVPLTQDQFDALTSLAFNTREESFKNSRMLRNLNAGNYLGAATEMLTFDHSGGVQLKGLTDRRRAEAIRFMGREVQRLPPSRPEN